MDKCLRSRSVTDQYRTKHMIKFCNVHQKTVLFLFLFQKIGGDVLFSFIATNLLVNSTVWVTIFMGIFPYVLRLFYLSFVIGQVMCLFLLHYMGALYVRKIHSPIKTVMTINMKTKKMSLYDRIRIHNNVQKFHNKKQYGVTYGSFGIVNMWSFSKVKSVQ